MSDTKDIRLAVLDALGRADEIGGPDDADYVDLMVDIAVECLARAGRASGDETLLARPCPTCDGDTVVCDACGKSRRSFEHRDVAHGHGPCWDAGVRPCAACHAQGAVVVGHPRAGVAFGVAMALIDRIAPLMTRVYNARQHGQIRLGDHVVAAQDVLEICTAIVQVQSLKP